MELNQSKEEFEGSRNADEDVGLTFEQIKMAQHLVRQEHPLSGAPLSDVLPYMSMIKKS